MTALFVVGEDQLCCSMAEALVAHAGVPVEIRPLITGGADPFRRKIPAMNKVADSVMPVLMVADGDQAACVVEQLNQWLPRNVSNRLLVRLAVREAEAWALADHVGFADFAQVSKDVVPPNPESEFDAKQALLSVIKRSRRRELRVEMLPSKGATSPVGLGYNVHMADFVKNHWSVDRAKERSPSLARTIPRIAELLGR
jgi:hypothetical protein